MAVYRSFLLRFRKKQDQHGWQASLEDVQTHELHHFVSAEAAVTYIYSEIINKKSLRSDKEEDNPTNITNL